MPLPRYMPVKKKPKVMSLSLDDLDDGCLSRIIGHALSQSSFEDDESTARDNGIVERNLSLVSKRWYFLTQTQIVSFGVHKINLDRVLKQNGKLKSTSCLGLTRNVPIRKPEVLMQRNVRATNRPLAAIQQQQSTVPVTKVSDSYDLKLLRRIRPKLLKYKHIILEGSLMYEDFTKLVVILNSARIERLDLRIKIENASKTSASAKNAFIPDCLPYLEDLTIYWSTDSKDYHSNGLSWIIYERAACLRRLKVILVDDNSDNIRMQSNQRDSIEQICNQFNTSSNREARIHPHLNSVIFNRSANGLITNCKYTYLIRGVLMREDSIDQVDTNDSALIEHLIKSSSRLSTSRALKSLRFLTPIKNLDLLAQLFKSKCLGTDRLSIIIDTIDHIEEVRLQMENFKLNRHESASSQISLYLKDQKFPDCEEKIKSLVLLSRLADVFIHVSALQRISIDCCHLMWSVGRALQSPDLPGSCLFRINLQTSIAGKSGSASQTEITVPFGKCLKYKINPNREDPSRHREIIKSLRKDCYHQFVKSVRDYTTP